MVCIIKVNTYTPQNRGVAHNSKENFQLSKDFGLRIWYFNRKTVILDNRLSCTQDVKIVSEKAVGTADKLIRIMPNIKRLVTRWLIASVEYAQAMYVIPKLCDVIAKRKNLSDHLEKVLRLYTFQILPAYRTKSTAALSILAGVFPIILTLDKRRYIWKGQLLPIGYTKEELSQIKQQTRDILLAQWQSICNNWQVDFPDYTSIGKLDE